MRKTVNRVSGACGRGEEREGGREEDQLHCGKLSITFECEFLRLCIFWP